MPVIFAIAVMAIILWRRQRRHHPKDGSFAWNWNLQNWGSISGNIWFVFFSGIVSDAWFACKKMPSFGDKEHSVRNDIYPLQLRFSEKLTLPISTWNATPMNHKLDHPRLSMALYELRLDCFDFFNPGRPRVRKYPYSNATDKKHTMQRINFYLLQLEERTSSRHSQNHMATKSEASCNHLV